MLAYQHIALVTFAYLLGSLSPGYWLAKRATGVDLRSTGSGATGASNAGRILGKRAFCLILLLDTLKGTLVAIVARYLMADVPLAWQFAASLAVVAGHIWPVWLGFRGGKGVATFHGAWCPLLNWQGFIPATVCFGLCLLLKLIFRCSIKRTWLALQGLFPLIIWWLLRGRPDAIPPVLITAAATLIIWFTHRRNIAEALGEKPEKVVF